MIKKDAMTEAYRRMKDDGLTHEVALIDGEYQVDPPSNTAETWHIQPSKVRHSVWNNQLGKWDNYYESFPKYLTL